MNSGKICPQCGKNNLVDKRFCVECGARLRDKGVALAGDQEMTPPTHEQREACQKAVFSHQEVIGLLQQIADPAAPAGGNAPQEELVARLVRMGPEAVPAAAGAIWAAIRYGERDPSRFRNAGLLCEAIGRMGGSKAFDALARFATQESTATGYPHVRAGAIRGLAHLDDRRAEPLLVAALNDPDLQVHDVAAWALDRDRSSASALSSEEDARDTTGEILDQPVEAQGTKSASPHFQRRRKMGLYGLADVEQMKSAQDVEGLIEASRSQGNPDVRKAAVEALGLVGGSQAVELLVAALRDPEESVRKAASNALGKVGDASAVKRLEPLVADENQDVRAAALEAVIRIGGRKQKTTQREATAFHIGFFLLGAVLFAIPIGIMWAAVQFDAGFLFFVGTGLVMLLVFLALKGLDWHPGGIYDWHTRVFVVMFLIVTFIGTILVCYWIGKGAMRWYLDVFA